MDNVYHVQLQLQQQLVLLVLQDLAQMLLFVKLMLFQVLKLVHQDFKNMQ